MARAAAPTLLFSAVFVYLARQFGYPGVLDLPAAQVLPRLLELGPAGRAVWLQYGLTPLLLVPTAIGVHAAGRHAAPSLHWQLALAYEHATPAAREAIAAVFAASNSYLGEVIGEFLGELFLNAFFLCAAVALAAAPARRWLLAAGIVASLLGGLAMLRNVTPWVEPVVALNNIVLPVWMLVLGLAPTQHRAGPTGAAAAPSPTHA